MTGCIRITAFLMVAALAACRGPDGAAPPAVETAPNRATPPASEPSAPTSPAQPATPRASDSATAPMPIVALDGEGLRLVNPTSGATRALAFGGDIAPVIDALTRIRGTEPTRTTNGECGAGPLDMATWPDGFTLVSQGGTFRGWSLNPRNGTDASARPATMAGLGLGSTRAELDDAYDATITSSSLGTEFAAGGLYGVLGSARADAQITALWAGTSCVFR